MGDDKEAASIVTLRYLLVCLSLPLAAWMAGWLAAVWWFALCLKRDARIRIQLLHIVQVFKYGLLLQFEEHFTLALYTCT